MLHIDNLSCGNMASWERMTDVSILHVLYLGYVNHSLLQMKCTLVSDQMEITLGQEYYVPEQIYFALKVERRRLNEHVISLFSLMN